ncbi:MAG: hypothetical protein AcusKO_49850 [Acuticoccus sp.]
MERMDRNAAAMDGAEDSAHDRETVPDAPLLARDTVGCPARLRNGLADALLSPTPEASLVTRRDLVSAARLLEIPHAMRLPLAELVAAIRSALCGSSEPAIERDLSALASTLRLAGRPTAANDILNTLRGAV